MKNPPRDFAERENFEDRARAIKATKLVRYLVGQGVSDPFTVRGYSDEERAAVCFECGVRLASDRTWSQVCGILQAFNDAVIDQ